MIIYAQVFRLFYLVSHGAKIESVRLKHIRHIRLVGVAELEKYLRHSYRWFDRSLHSLCTDVASMSFLHSMRGVL